ncbi:MAG: CHAT domain-containing protein [Scytonematopsis contorta HA4267-MV1]|jgi:low affinity Fe/Cu permease|nr:CHAT domain-containing protein [Scytonematopsis contorta HA4267-MV1]
MTNNTRVKTILILTAIPHGLRLDKEIRSIEEAIRRAVKRDSYKIVLKTAVRPQDIRRAIAEEQPQIVHFCGHGLSDGSLLLENDAGKDTPVSAESLASLFQLHADYVECVLLNACHSAKPANAIKDYINNTIGMNQPIGDEAAILFATGFYDGLGYKISSKQNIFSRAFEEGKIAIKLEQLTEDTTPVFYQKPNITPINKSNQPMTQATIPANKIISLAFTKVLNQKVNKFSEAAQEKIDELHQKICDKLKDNPRAVKALTAVESGSKEHLEKLATYLGDEMEEDEEFANSVQALAREINAGRIPDEGRITQNNYDNARGWVTTVDGGTNYIGEIHINESDA